MKLVLKLLPLVVFVALAAFLYRGLSLDPSELPSPLIDKPAPSFVMGTLPPGQQPFDSSSMAGQVWVLNVWASWCRPCIQEHPLIIRLAQQMQVPVVGLNYKDDPTDAQRWLNQYGDPFAHVLSDQAGDVGLDYGVYGVPESFIIDRQGIIRYKQVGPIDEASLTDTIMPLIERLKEHDS